jgi:hypothetical protein
MTDTNRPKNEVIEMQKTNMNSLILDDEIINMAGMGKENVTAANVLIPRLVILQGLSPQINKKKAEYIDGAEVGDFCNVATGDIYKDEILVVPCHFATAYMEWVKNRGGLVANHGSSPAILNKCIQNEKGQYFLPNGNSVEETAQWYCLLQDGATWARIFFPLKATNLKHSRRWLTACQAEQVRLPDNTIWKPPLFFRSWKLKIIDDSNDQGDWATFRPERGDSTVEIDPSKELIRLCKSFYEDIRKNVVRPDIDTQDGGTTINGTTNKTTTDKDIPF